MRASITQLCICCICDMFTATHFVMQLICIQCASVMHSNICHASVLPVVMHISSSVVHTCVCHAVVMRSVIHLICIHAFIRYAFMYLLNMCYARVGHSVMHLVCICCLCRMLVIYSRACVSDASMYLSCLRFGFVFLLYSHTEW